MATDGVMSTMPSSFVYENLVSHVQAIQTQMTEFENILDDRWKNNKIIPDKIKSHSVTFIDPYGNKMIDQHMDHEPINKLVRKFKKDYVPKYLHQWIRIGTLDKNDISPLTDCDLQSTVSKYANNYQFIAYGEVTVWIGRYESLPPEKCVLKVLLTDDLEKIKLRIKAQQYLPNVELKLIEENQKTVPIVKNWSEGTILKSEDTIMSCRLYQDNCTIMAKVIREKVNHCLPYFF
jgi:hypothetical protein